MDSVNPHKGMHGLLDQMNDAALELGMQDAVFPCRPLKVVVYEHNTVIGRFKGGIGLPNNHVFTASMTDLVSDNVHKIILDFSKATLSRSGLGALVAFASMVHGLGKRLYLYDISDQIRANLEATELTPFFVYLHTEDDIIMQLVV